MSSPGQLSIAEWVAAYEARFGRMRREGRDHRGRCPMCGGSETSRRFYIRQGDSAVLIGCNRCNPTIGDVARELSLSGTNEPPPPPPPPGCTIEQLANKCGFAAEMLTELYNIEQTTARVQVDDDGESWDSVPAVRIPYWDNLNPDASVRAQLRVRITNADGRGVFRWESGSAPIVPYTLLNGQGYDAQDVVLCEGVTDAWTWSQSGWSVRALPGNKQQSCLRPGDFGRARRVLLIEENDEAGKVFVDRGVEWLRANLPGVAPIVVQCARLSEKDTNAIYKNRAQRDLGRCGRLLSWLVRTSRGPGRKPFNRFQTLGDIRRGRYPAIVNIVDGILTEGLWALIGAPKGGKSLWILQLLEAIGGAGFRRRQFCGCDVNVDPTRCESLLINLETPAPRMHHRLGYMSALGAEALDKVHYFNQWKLFEDGGIRDIDGYLADNPGVCVVVVDVLGALFPAVLKGNVFNAEYQIYRRLKKIADKHQAAILLVHHLNATSSKAEYHEPYQGSISGSMALPACVDGQIYLWRMAEDVAEVDSPRAMKIIQREGPELYAVGSIRTEPLEVDLTVVPRAELYGSQA